MEPVALDYAELLDPASALSDRVAAAFGPDGLGLLTVRGVPSLPARRARLLPLAARVAALPPAARAALEDPASRYNLGWSCGREVLRAGQPDTHKGSFYANPLADEPTRDPLLLARHPAYCRPNLWPRRDLPDLEAAFKALGALVVEVGLLVASRCDAYLQERGSPAPPGRLHGVIARSPCAKGRLLHYFPPAAGGGGEAAEAGGEEDGWCGWHTDHGSLTGLTSALYLDAGSGAELPCPDPAAGLYIRTRAGAVVRAVIPPDHLAFQVGEAMQVHSGGLLAATPHCVRAPGAAAARGTSRNAFAVFMQPRWDEPLDCPGGGCGVAHWAPGDTFGEFSERTFAAYYT